VIHFLASAGAAVVGLAGLMVLLLLAGSIGRWLAVRSLGVRGVPFPFGAGARWSWTTSSVFPQLLGIAGSVACMYTAIGAVMAVGVWGAGVDGADETNMHVVVEPDGPADRAGVQQGDRVDAVNGERVTTWDALRGAIAAHPRERVDLDVTRDGASVRIVVTPDASGRIRVGRPVVHRDATVGEGLYAGIVGPAYVLFAVMRSVAMTIAGQERAYVGGPFAIVREAGRQSRGVDAIAYFGVLGAYLLPPFAIGAVFIGPGRRRSRRVSAASCA
jgi:hypothetical protein